MISLNEVLAQIQPTLQALEEQRLANIQQQRRIALVAFPILTLLLLLVLLLRDTTYVTWIIGALGGCAIAALIWYSITVTPRQQAYTRTYKSRVTQAILQQIDPNLHFSMEQGISQKSFTYSELYKRPDRYKTEDMISGTMGVTQVRFAEVNAQERQESTDSDGRRKVSYRTFFNGILFQADFNKAFSGRTFVMPDRAERSFGNIGRTFQKLGGQRGTRLALLDNPEFEQRFAVYTTDDIECRYLLSPALMERLLTLDLGDIRIAFKDSLLWITIPRRTKHLEPSLRTPATSLPQITQFASSIVGILSIIETLDLNTRIWSKE